jgi:dihydroorotase
VGPPLRCHRYCAPVCKRPEDREALQRLVLRSEPAVARKVFLGTDSAPHEVAAKECADACPGIFTAPIALPLVAQIFEGREDRIQGFASDYARDFYRLDLPARTVTLVREPFLVPHHYRGVVPLYAGTGLRLILPVEVGLWRLMVVAGFGNGP